MVSHDIGNDRTQTMMMFDRTQPKRKQLAKPVEPICQSKSARIGGAILGSISGTGRKQGYSGY